jgi:hypothetical protein
MAVWHHLTRGAVKRAAMYNTRRTLFVSLCALVVGSLITLPAAAGLKETIAEKFGLAPGSFVLNLPPRPGCLPGSIFTEDLRVPLVRTKRDDPKLEFGPVFQFSADVSVELGANAGAGFSGWFGVAAKASAVSNAVMEFKDARIIELLGPELKRRVMTDPDALAASARKLPPFAVLRAFEGTVTVTLTKKDSASAEAWGKAKQTALDAKIGANIGAEDKIVISVADSFVFGFEVVQVNYIAQHLGAKPDNVNLVPVPDDLFQR